MKKIFASPGVSSRPLNRFEKLKKALRDLREGYLWDGNGFTYWLKNKIYCWRHRKEIKRQDEFVQELFSALNTGSYSAKPDPLVSGEPLQIEDISAVMTRTTYSGEIKFRPRHDFLPWWLR
jgi:hypothetical protein